MQILTLRRLLTIAGLMLLMVGSALGKDIAGTWTASFDTQIGVQNYTYEFKVDGEKLTGTAKSQFGGSDITQGTVKGDVVSFIETFKFEDQVIPITYTGKISGDEIKFTRKVGDLATEELVAKRSA